MTKKELVGNIASEFLPVGSFVLISETMGFQYGLKALCVTTIFALIFSWFIERRLPKFGLFAASIILLFASLSIMFHNPFFIIIKDTIYYFSFGTAIFLGLITGRSIFKYFFGDFFAITERGWNIISFRWAIFFYILTIGNEIARHVLLPVDWTAYKLCVLVVTWIFGSYQLRVTIKERLPLASPLGLRLNKKI